MKRYIRNAEQSSTKEDLFDETVSRLKDDFNFAMDGIEKIAADGDIDKALELVNTTSAMINGAIEDIAEDITTAE